MITIFKTDICDDVVLTCWMSVVSNLNVITWQSCYILHSGVSCCYVFTSQRRYSQSHLPQDLGSVDIRHTAGIQSGTSGMMYCRAGFIFSWDIRHESTGVVDVFNDGCDAVRSRMFMHDVTSRWQTKFIMSLPHIVGRYKIWLKAEACAKCTPTGE